MECHQVAGGEPRRDTESRWEHNEKQLRTATRGSLPALVLNDVLTTPHQNANVLQNITEALGLNRSFWMA